MVVTYRTGVLSVLILLFALAVLGSGCLTSGKSATGGQLSPEGKAGVPSSYLVIEAVGPRSNPYKATLGATVGFRNGEPVSEFVITSISDNWEMNMKISPPGAAPYTFTTAGTYTYKIEWTRGPTAGESYEGNVVVE